jgi:hypothetical protein
LGKLGVVTFKRMAVPESILTVFPSFGARGGELDIAGVWFALEVPDYLPFEAAGMRMSDVLTVHFFPSASRVMLKLGGRRVRGMMREARATIDAQRALVEPHQRGRTQ